MKALSLIQPWASLVAIEAKRIETRPRYTAYRGPLIVCASKRYPKWAQDLWFEPPFFDALHSHFGNPRELPVGAALCLVNLAGCVKTTELHKLDAISFKRNAAELAFGDFSEGRYAWALEHVRSFAKPIPVKGALGLWEWPRDSSI
jgi:hypothetical protein